MSRFISIVRNYEKICRLGHEIINHKDLVRRAKPDKLSEEFIKQEKRIERFAEEINNANAAILAEKIVLININIICMGLKIDIQPKLSNKMH